MTKKNFGIYFQKITNHLQNLKVIFFSKYFRSYRENVNGKSRIKIEFLGNTLTPLGSRRASDQRRGRIRNERKRRISHPNPIRNV